MKALVLAEHDGENLSPSTRSTITAAKAFAAFVPGLEIELLILGAQCTSVTLEAQKISDLNRILMFEDPGLNIPSAEQITSLLMQLSSHYIYDYILAPATTFGKNCLPRFAALKNVGQLSEIIAVLGADIVLRPIYAGNAIEKIQSLDPLKVITVRATAFSPAVIGGDNNKIISEDLKDKLSLKTKVFKTQVLGLEGGFSEGPDLSRAKIVVAGGRGLQTKENFKLIEDLAKILGAGIGASRAAVDAGFIANEYQVGQTGKMVAPDLYIAIGISGAIQHLAGMKESKVIVAINKDPDAPIFKIASYGLVGDLFSLVPELIDLITKIKKR